MEEYQQSENGTEYQPPENGTGVECNGLFVDQEQLTRSSSTSDIRDQCISDVFQGNMEAVKLFCLHLVLSVFKKICLVWCDIFMH